MMIGEWIEERIRGIVKGKKAIRPRSFNGGYWGILHYYPVVRMCVSWFLVQSGTVLD